MLKLRHKGTHLKLRQGVVRLLAIVLPLRAVVAHHAICELAIEVNLEGNLAAGRKGDRKGQCCPFILVVIRQGRSLLDNVLLESSRSELDFSEVELGSVELDRVGVFDDVQAG